MARSVGTSLVRGWAWVRPEGDAALLEKYVRDDPYNWFNFFDFWRGGNE